jgi:hypothetical protein
MNLHLIVMSMAVSMALVGCGSGDTTSAPKEERSNNLPSGDVRRYDELNIGIEDNINIDEENKEDWFAVKLTADTYTLYSELLTGTQSSNKVKITVYDTEGTTLLGLDTNGNAGSWNRDTFKVEKDGLYKIKVESVYNSEAIYKFTLFHSIAGGLLQDNLNERNDNKYMATPITFEEAHQTVTGNLNIDRESDNEDWYSIELTPDTYTLYSNMLIGTQYEVGYRTTTNATIYSPNGIKVLDTSVGYRVGDWTSKSFSAKTTGKYLIQLKVDNKSDAVYDFSLYHSIDSGLVQTGSGERNDNKYMATAITLNQSNNGVSGDINIQRVSDTHDWYSISLSTGSYNLNYELLTGTEHTSWFEKIYFNVYTPDGVKVVDSSENAISGKSYNETFTANQAGKYMIEISNERDAKNVYKFTISQ